MPMVSLKMIPAIRFLFLAIAILTLASCIIPFVNRRADPYPFSAKRLAFIVDGEAHKNDLLEEFGTPRIKEEHWWLYTASRRGTEWVFLFIIASGYAAEAFESGPVGGKYTTHHLLIGFNERGIAEHFGLFKDDRPCDNKNDICLSFVKTANSLESVHPLLVLLRGDSQSDNSAKTFVPSEDRCGFYFYISESAQKQDVQLYLDGTPLGVLKFRDAYIYVETFPGTHSILASTSAIGGRPVKFSCADEDLVFAKWGTSRQTVGRGTTRTKSVEWKPKVEVVSRDEGLSAIRKRRIAVPLSD